jgi:hypothetical protein
MKISKFNKFHKNRSLYENTIMEPVEDVTVDVGQPQSQMTKSQAQRSVQAQPSRRAQLSSMSEPKVDNLEILATKFDIEHDGSNAFYVEDFRIEQISENGHFVVFKGDSEDAIDTKTTDADKAKIFIDKLVADTKVKPQTPTKPMAPPMPKETPGQKPVVTPAKAQGSQMAQEPKMIGERRSNKKNSKNRLYEFEENPYMKSGGMTNIGGGHTGDTKKLLAKSQEVSAMEPIDKYLHFINQLSISKTDKASVEMILHNCYIELSKAK